MKVALLVPGGMHPSGTREVIPVLLWLVRRLARVHEVHVFALRGGLRPRRYPLEGAIVHDVGGRTPDSPRTLRAVAAVLAEHRRGRFDLVHAFWASGPGVPAAIAGRLLRRPVLLHVTGGDTAALPELGYGGRLTLRGRMAVGLALASSAHRTVPSSGLRSAVEALGHDAEMLPLGVDRDDWPAAPPRPRRPDRPARLVHVGSLNRVKDHPTLLRALARLTDRGLAWTLDAVGEDTLGGRVQRLAEELSVARRVRFHGFLPQARLHPLVAAADLMLVSSRHEGDPVAMLEAAVVGVPTVGTAVGHVRDWSPDAAVAVPVGDAEALARETERILRHDGRRTAMAREAQRRALARDADWSAERILELYERVTSDGRLAPTLQDGFLQGVAAPPPHEVPGVGRGGVRA